MVQRLPLCLAWVIGLTTCIAGHTQAQPIAVLVGVEAAAYQTKNPHGGMAALGAMVGLERPVSDQLSVRVTATALRGLRLGDDISVCLLAPDGSCIPDPVFPLWLSRIEVLGACAPVRFMPLRILLGGGISIAGDAREPERSSPRLAVNTKTQATWRAGVDLRLGSSSHAPRIQFTRMGFSKNPFSLSFVDALSIVFRP